MINQIKKKSINIFNSSMKQQNIKTNIISSYHDFADLIHSPLLKIQSNKMDRINFIHYFENIRIDYKHKV